MEISDIVQCFNCNNEFAHSDEEIRYARILLIKALQENITYEKYIEFVTKYMESRSMREEEKEVQLERISNLETYFE